MAVPAENANLAVESPASLSLATRQHAAKWTMVISIDCRTDFKMDPERLERFSNALHTHE